MTSTLTVSLDFELFWGVRDKRSLDSYGSNILGGRRAIPAILNAFARYDIAATWAVVGLLCFSNKSDMLDSLPACRPSYRRVELSPYRYLDDIGDNEKDDPFHFGYSLVSEIIQTPRMEIGTHTFSHYYCLEDGHDSESFKADLVAATEVAGRFGVRPRSIVFPRNQYDGAALEVCRQLDLTAYRGNENSWLYEPRSGNVETRIRRGLRLVDAHLPISRLSTFHTDGAESLPVDVRSSRLLRPVRPERPLPALLRLNRIKQGMTAAAKHGLGYHIWWHPHNFGANVDANLNFLEAVLCHFEVLKSQYGMQSMNMAEVTLEAFK